MSRPLRSLLTAASSYAGLTLLLLPRSIRCETADVQTIVQKSVTASQADFAASPEYSYTEREHVGEGTRTTRTMMIEGSPYHRLIAINDKPLPKEEAAEEEQKLQEAIRTRKAESSQQRRARIAKYQKDRQRDNSLMRELTKAFDFELVGERQVDSFRVYVLKATPKAGYQPPSFDTQALRGMQGELWIDTRGFHWVKVTARVVHPVSIEGFLARVEPGTQFELEMRPVEDRVWQATHYAMKAKAKILYLVNHSSQEEEDYFDYKRESGNGGDLRSTQ